PVTIHSRPEGAEGAWTRHAAGALAEDADDPQSAADPDPGTWPPAAATALDTEGAYERLLDRGYGFGPAFQGLRAAWRRGDELFAEIAIADRDGAGGYGVHPALL